MSTTPARPSSVQGTSACVFRLVQTARMHRAVRRGSHDILHGDVCNRVRSVAVQRGTASCCASLRNCGSARSPTATCLPFVPTRTRLPRPQRHCDSPAHPSPSPFGLPGAPAAQGAFPQWSAALWPCACPRGTRIRAVVATRCPPAAWLCGQRRCEGGSSGSGRWRATATAAAVAAGSWWVGQRCSWVGTWGKSGGGSKRRRVGPWSRGR